MVPDDYPLVPWPETFARLKCHEMSDV
jgi:hypothetical protein